MRDPIWYSINGDERMTDGVKRGEEVSVKPQVESKRGWHAKRVGHSSSLFIASRVV